MGPVARKEEARKIEEAKEGRHRRALSREAVGSDLKEAIHEMGLMEDIVRDEACEKGIVKGGGIRKTDKADVAIFKGLKLDSVPAWAEYGQGRGRGRGRGDANPNWGCGGARGGQGSRGARGRGGRGDRGHGGARGGQGSRGARGRGGRGDRGGGGDLLSGGNIEAITEWRASQRWQGY
jgi:hypothetical protein